MAITSKPLMLEAVQQLISAHAGGSGSPFNIDQESPLEPVVDLMIDGAVLAFSDYRPRIVTHQFTLIADQVKLDLSTLDADKPWVQKMSTVRSKIECPSGEDPPVYLDDNSWRYYPCYENATHIYMDQAYDAGDTADVTYSTIHVLDDTSSSLSVVEIQALLYLCMGRYAEYKATYSAYRAGKSFDSEVEENSDSTSWRRLAEMYYKQVDNMIGSNFIGNKDDNRFKQSKTATAHGSRIDYDPKTRYGTPLFTTHKQR